MGLRYRKSFKLAPGIRLNASLREKCEEINRHVEALGELHLNTPNPSQKPTYDMSEFDEPAPLKPTARGLGLWGRLFRSVRRRIEEENESTRRAHELAMEEWRLRKAAFGKAQEARQELIEKKIYADQDSMEVFLEESLKDITWPRETSVDFEVSEDGRRVVLNADLPEIEDMPRQAANVPQRGYKLTVKALSDSKVRMLYLQHIHGIGFRIIGETFWSLPLVREVEFSAYSQRANKATGMITDDYLYSVRVHRYKWSEIDFDNLESIDVVTALELFDLRRDMKKTGVLDAIVPFGPNSIS